MNTEPLFRSDHLQTRLVLRRIGFAMLQMAVAILLAGQVTAKADDVKFPSDYLPTHFDLSELPIYKPEHRLLGTIRVYGTPLEGLYGKWMAAFRGEYHGQVRMTTYSINTSQAFAGLVMGVADIGFMGHRTWHTSRAAFEKVYGYAPLEIKFANGS